VLTGNLNGFFNNTTSMADTGTVYTSSITENSIAPIKIKNSKKKKV